MTRAEMLATFFVHDGETTQKWRLKGHAEADFWKWVCSWAVMLKRPSDIGYPDTGFDLPPLQVQHLTVANDAAAAQSSGLLFNMPALTLQERRDTRRATIASRVARCAEMVNGTADAWVIWCNLNAEADAITAAIPGAIQVAGSDTLDDKMARLDAFADGAIRVLVTKPSIAGFGMNWQHCHRMAFLGLSDSYEQFYQSVRRSWRFGQAHPVEVCIVTSEADAAVVANIERKEREAQKMADEMIRNMASLNGDDLHGVQRAAHDTAGSEVAEGDGWTIHRGDCVEVSRTLADNAIDYSIFSPPFASLYTYTASDADMGNCRNHGEFAEHLSFLVPELLRVTKPGRLLSFHCMNLPTSKSANGYIGITDFRGLLIRLFQEHGWIFHSEVVIWKDPVTAMQRTKALGLLYKQLRKDSAMSRQGIPDYLVTMRKPGTNPEPVTKTHESFPVGLWQNYASPVWMDINQSNTLQRESAREEKDERHICPLQLEVIERAIELWTNPGDLVLSPFAGIGSEGYVALGRGRRFIGIELKQSYWDQATANMRAAIVRRDAQGSLFTEAEP